MIDDLTQQSTDISQDPQIPESPQVPETPQEPPTVETPPIQEPIAQESVQPPIIPVTEETPVIPSEPSIPPNPTNPPNPPVEPIPIPQFRLPFNENFPLTFSFGVQPTTDELKQKFLEWGISGHHGLDFGLPEETEVLAVDSGKIIQSGNNADFGISVTIQHSWGQSLYAHLKETKVSVDQNVNSGDVIASSGQTGSAFGQHLHFGIKPHNPDQNNGYLGFINPLPYLPPIPQVPQNPQTPQEPKIIEKEVIKEVIREVPVEKIVEKEVIKEIPVVDQAEVDRRSREKLLAELEVLRQKANQTRQDRKNENLVKIEKLIQEKGKITNDDICDFLHISQSTATYYLQTLVKQGKIKSEGKARSTIYKSIFS